MPSPADPGLQIEEGMTHFIWMRQRVYQRSCASIVEAGES